MEFRILGPLEVVNAAGQTLNLGGPRQRALLVALLLRVGKVVPQDELIDKLWGEQPPRTAVTSLQNSVSLLRKILGAGVVVTRPPGYAVDVDPNQIDATRFRKDTRSRRWTSTAA